MTINVQQRRSRFQLRVTHKLLPKPFFFTFDSADAARDYGNRLDGLLARGVVPVELLEESSSRKGFDILLAQMLSEYTKCAPITDSDDALLGHMMDEITGVRMSQVTFSWVDAYVGRLKMERQLKPSTIRKRVGVLGRVVDWHLRRTTPTNETVPANPFRLLPTGYSSYSRSDAERLDAVGLKAKRDEVRDRRMTPEELQSVEDALNGHAREDRERSLAIDPAFTMLYALLIDTGMRLSEGFRLRVEQVDLAKGLLKIDGSKGHRGALKPRNIPLKPELKARLQTYCTNRVGLMFPFWDGSREDFRKCSARLSARFATLFDYAGVPDFSCHDLRHEATCRWVTLRNPRGNWTFNEVEICRIMGWTDMSMMLRYGSLRGEDLVSRLS
jgi:integrase